MVILQKGELMFRRNFLSLIPSSFLGFFVKPTETPKELVISFGDKKLTIVDNFVVKEEFCNVVFFYDENGFRHRNDDLPAAIWKDNHQQWYQHGLLHRDGDLPAVINADGTQEWWQNGWKIK